MSNLKNCSISLPMKNQQPIEQSIKLFQVSDSSKLKQQQLKQKIDNNIQKKPTPQIFQDTSNLPQAQLIYLNNQGLTPGSQQSSTTFGAKWSPVKATKVQADEDCILTQRNQNLANAQENIKNYQIAQTKSSKENTIQSVFTQNTLQASQQKIYHHHKNFQSCGGINLGQFNQQMHPQFIDQDNLISPNQSVKNSRMLNSTHSTNNFILNRKDSGNLINNQNVQLNDTLAQVSNGSSQQNLNINNVSNIGVYNPLSNMSSPLNQSVNVFLQSTRNNKQIEEAAYKQQQLPIKDQQKQISSTFNQFPQSHRVSQVQSKSISSIQQIGINLEQLISPQSNLQDKTRSFTPNQRAANGIESKIKKNQNCFLNNQQISNSIRTQKQNYIQYSNYPMNLIEEENLEQIDKLIIKNNTGPNAQKVQDKKIFSEDTYKNEVKQVSLKQLSLNNLQGGQHAQGVNLSNHLQNNQQSKVNLSNNNIAVQTPQNSNSNQYSQNALIQQLLAPFQPNKQINQQPQQQQQQQQQQQKYQQFTQQNQLIQPKNQQQQLQFQQSNLYQTLQNVQQQQQQYASTNVVNNISNNNNNSQNNTTNKFVFDQYCINQKKVSTHDNGTHQNATLQQSCQNLIINNSNNFNSNKIFNQSSQNFMMASAQNSVKSQVPNLNLNFDQSVQKIQSNTGSTSNRSSTPSLLHAIISPQCRQQMTCMNPLTDKSSVITPSNKFIPTNLQFQDGQNIGITTLLNNQMNLNNKQMLNNTNIQNSKSNNSNITTIISANNNNNNVKQKIQNNNTNNISNQKNYNNTNLTQSNTLLQQTKDEQSLINILGCSQNCEYEYTPRNQNTQAQHSAASYGTNQKQQIPHHQSSKSLSGVGNKSNFNKNSETPQNQQNNSYFNIIQDIMKSVEKNNQDNCLQKTPKVEISLKSNTPSTPQVNYLNASPQLISKQPQKEKQSSSNIQLSSQQDSTKNQIEVFQVTDFKQSTSSADVAIFKPNKKEKLCTETIDTNIFFPVDTYKNIKTEVSQSNNGQILLLSQNQQLNTEQSDSFYYYQSKRKYNVKDFEFIKLLGQGVFGQVHMVRQINNKFIQNFKNIFNNKKIKNLFFNQRDKKTKGIFALKLIDKQMIKEKEMETQLQRELNIHSQYSNHENVLECLGYFEDEKYYYLLLEYASDGTCASLIENLPLRRLTEQQSCNIVKQILESVNYLHKNKIIHRDLKLENVLISNGKVKLCDFGCATFCDNPPYQRRRSFCGTLDYVSPEMIQDQIYDKEIDIWAIGVITFELCSGFAPFTQFNDQQTYSAIQNVKHAWPKCFSEELKDFIQKIFVVDPTQRATASQLLYHDWILKHENFNLKSA
ncbi:protein kinase (macronuclear) [Tetrahymena thermophila SB210]|uniref:Protein kinase n=1 Tax=Tetrahymena thermophila (strain SB210) TaxID=312017 RepID=I7M1Y8_TETTS|nr:protein kinase [Tetrahymena thermophila SB210]EAR98139.2 protein kinase [Tetrahymena thermophila SB210]|eukprot:XP_001018384.2 protein kinase [Tetrahymena thermophila SB210]